MRGHLREVLFVALFVAGCDAAAPPVAPRDPNAAPPDPQATAAVAPPVLTWGDSTKAKVRAQLKGERRVERKSVAWALEGSFALVVDSREGGVLVQPDDFEGWQGDMPKAMVAAPTILLPALGGLNIGPDGAFRSLADPAAARTGVESLRESTGWASAEVSSVAEAGLSDAGLQGIAAECWSRLYGTWSGLQVDEQKGAEGEGEVEVAPLGGRKLKQSWTLTRDADEGCPGASDRQCEVFTLRSRVAPESGQAVAAGLAGAEVASFESESILSVRLEAGNRRPHEVVLHRETSATLATGDASAEISDIMLQFTY